MSVNWELIVQATAILVAAGSVYAGLAGIRHQIHTTTFIEYSKQYSALWSEFRHQWPNIRKKDFAELSGEERDAADAFFSGYFELLHQVYRLRQTRYIPRRTWAIWARSMKANMAEPLFRTAWFADYRKGYELQKDFLSFVDKVARPL